MKTSTIIASLLFVCLFNINLKSQEDGKKLFASVTPSQVKEIDADFHPIDSTSVSAIGHKDDVVINMAMIESFRRCYNKIEPFSLTDFLAGDANEVSTKYMAYMRARLHPESIDVALASEMKTVQNALKQKNNVNVTDIAYNEKTTAQMENLPIQEEVKTTSVSARNNNYKSVKKVNGVKWIEIKSTK